MRWTISASATTPSCSTPPTTGRIRSPGRILGTTPFRSEKNTNWGSAFRVPCLIRWPGRIQPGSISNDIVSALDWLPTLMAAAGETEIKDKLLRGYQARGKTYKGPSRLL